MGFIAAALEKAQFAFKDESFSLNGPLNRERDRLMTDLVVATRANENKEGGGDRRINIDPVKDLQKQIAALEDKMRASLITVRFTAVNKGVWNKWVMQHGPRKNNQLDLNLGYNADAFFPFVARETGQAVEFGGTEEQEYADAILHPIESDDWAKLDEVLTDGDWDRIAVALINLNQKDGQRGADFLTRGSKATSDSDES